VKLTTKLLGAACAIAFSALATTAANASVAGTLSGSYANVNGGGASADVWGVKGALTGMFSGSWGVEANGSYHNQSGGGGDDWAIGGNLFWAGSDVKVAGQVMYHDLGAANFTNFGAGVTWFAGPSVNLSVRGGGYSGTGTSGAYVGGDIDWYVMDNLSLSGRVDYIDIGTGITTEAIQAEWLFSETTPVSLYGGYQHLDVAGGNANVWFIGIKLYANAGGGTLRDRQRNGTLGYIGDSPLFIDQY
jgi:hypothetical protein